MISWEDRKCEICGRDKRFRGDKDLGCPVCRAKTDEFIFRCWKSNVYEARKRWKQPATLSLKEWKEILLHFDYHCAYCGEPYTVMEHYIPVGLAGTTAYNCVPGCDTCNSRKIHIINDRVATIDQCYIGHRIFIDIERVGEYLVSRGQTWEVIYKYYSKRNIEIAKSNKAIIEGILARWKSHESNWQAGMWEIVRFCDICGDIRKLKQCHEVNPRYPDQLILECEGCGLPVVNSRWD